MTFYLFPGDYESLDDDVSSVHGNFSRYRSYRGVDVPDICPAGSYCLEGTEHGLQYLCPAGTYSNQTGLENDGQCTPCDPGWYCSGEGVLLYTQDGVVVIFPQLHLQQLL